MTTIISNISRRLSAAAAVCVAFALLATGCITYNPTELSKLSTVDLCELREIQGPNMTQESRRAVQTELERRKEVCSSHEVELAARREAFLYHEMYGKPDP